MPAKTLNGTARDHGVKRFLRRRVSHEYFKDGNWTSNPAEASSFTDVVEAAEICVRYGLDDVELALRFDSAAEDVFCIPIR